MKRLFLLLALITIIIAGCKKSENSGSAAMNKIAGKWNWVMTTRGFQPPITPKTEIYNEQIVFSPNGSYVVYRNNLLDRTGLFSIDTNANGHPCIRVDGNNCVTYSVTDSTLNYGDGPVDGYHFYYER